MTLEEASEALSRFVPDSSMKANYTLDRMHALMDRLGNPQDTYRSVHIAGTSGKTSTAYFISGMLETAGVKPD
jgi:dihydrofolate synthase/folylpolyglutamate synthase